MEATKEQTSFERKMSKINNAVVFIKNISKEDFTHTYDGIPYPLPAGEQTAFPYPVAMHLAKHLAMKIVRDAKVKTGEVGEKDRLGKPVNIYKNLQEVIDKIIVERIEQPLPPTASEGEILKQKTVEIQKQFPDKKAKVSKKEIIATLKERKIKFDPRAEIDELLKLVVESEKNAE